jgi:NAD-dependent DNA ligase
MRESHWFIRPAEMTELTEPMECPSCGFHVRLDVTFIEQDGAPMRCPNPTCEFVGYADEAKSAS